jgi:hypothetical protein
MDRSCGRSALVHRVYLAIVGHGKAGHLEQYLGLHPPQKPEACPAATKRHPVILGSVRYAVTEVPAVFSRIVCALLEC